MIKNKNSLSREITKTKKCRKINCKNWYLKLIYSAEG